MIEGSMKGSHNQPDQQHQLVIERLRKLLELMARDKAADEIDETFEKQLSSSSFDDNNIKYYSKSDDSPFFLYKKSAPKRIFIGKRQQQFPMFFNG